MTLQSFTLTAQSISTLLGRNFESSAITCPDAALEEDQTLLEMLASSDRARAEAALEVIYRRHSRNVYSLARRIVRDADAAEEVVQDAFMKLWRNAPKYDSSRGSVSAWLLTITHHASVDHVRHASSRALTFPEQHELESVADRRQPERNADVVMLEGALDALRPDEQALIQLAYYEGLTHAQIVMRTRLPLGTVKTRLRSTLMRLRNHLGPS